MHQRFRSTEGRTERCRHEIYVARTSLPSFVLLVASRWLEKALVLCACRTQSEGDELENDDEKCKNFNRKLLYKLEKTKKNYWEHHVKFIDSYFRRKVKAVRRASRSRLDLSMLEKEKDEKESKESEETSSDHIITSMKPLQNGKSRKIGSSNSSSEALNSLSEMSTAGVVSSKGAMLKTALVFATMNLMDGIPYSN